MYAAADASTESSHSVPAGAPVLPFVTPADLRRGRVEWLVLALVLTVTATSFPSWTVFSSIWQQDLFGVQRLPFAVYWNLLFVLLGLLLCLPSRRQSGLQVGSIRQHWKKVLLVCGVPPLLTAIVYPLLPVKPFAGASYTMWLLSPLAQSLLFIGFLYGKFERLFPSYIHPRVPVNGALLVTVGYFALWHLPNFESLPAGYVLFQLFYTSLLYIVPALSRQWTGSIIYVVCCHSAINFIAWYAS